MGDRPPTGTPSRVRTPPNDSRRNVATAASPRPRVKDSGNTFCRNITIYGWCRFEGKGCAFNHDPQNQKPNGSFGRGKFNVDSPSFTPSTPPRNVMSPKAADAAPFTPKGTATPPVQPNFHDAVNSYNIPQVADHGTYSQSLHHSFESMGLSDNTTAAAINPYADYTPSITASGQVNPYVQGHGDIFYTPASNYSMPLNYHLYAPSAPYPQKLLPYQRNAHSFFISDNLREELQRKQEATLQRLDSSNLPVSINEYTQLVPLDPGSRGPAPAFGYPSWIYKAMSNDDGNYYALRRIEGFRLSNESDIRIVQRWKKVHSASMVTIHNAWTTTKFGDSSIVFVYDYHPLSKTLADTHFGQSPMFSHGTPEAILWSYITQIANALRAIHGTGLAARCIELSKVLFTSKMRIRLSCCGILDVLRPEQRPPTEVQADDFIALGKMILILACHNPMAPHNFAKSVDYVAKTYSSGFRDLIYQLCTGTIKTVGELAVTVADHTFQSFDSSLHYNDELENQLKKEVENGRIVRLLCKLGFVNERPEYDMDPTGRWSETGDRFYLKLFRDYVFHSVDSDNQPVVDLAHVLTCLNKLDAGIDEKVMLVSRDNNNCFVISYKELKRYIENSFQELLKTPNQNRR